VAGRCRRTRRLRSVVPVAITLSRNTAAALTISYGGLTLLPQLLKAMPTSVYHALAAWVSGGDAISS
jgi:hypothetical protein